MGSAFPKMMFIIVRTFNWGSFIYNSGMPNYKHSRGAAMVRLRWPLLAVAAWLLPVSLFAQDSSKVVIVDFERAVVQSSEGKKAEQKFNAKVEERRKDVEKKQKELEDAQNRLKTGKLALNDAAQAQLTKDIERLNTELKRINEDVQHELDELRSGLLQPIAEVASKLLKDYAAEQGFTLVIDVSNPQGSVLYANEKSDITMELIRRIDAAVAKTATKDK